MIYLQSLIFWIQYACSYIYRRKETTTSSTQFNAVIGSISFSQYTYYILYLCVYCCVSSAMEIVRILVYAYEWTDVSGIFTYIHIYILWLDLQWIFVNLLSSLSSHCKTENFLYISMDTFMILAFFSFGIPSYGIYATPNMFM